MKKPQRAGARRGFIHQRRQKRSAAVASIGSATVHHHGAAHATGSSAAHAASAAAAAHAAGAAATHGSERSEWPLGVDAELAHGRIGAGGARAAIHLAVGAGIFADAITDGTTHQNPAAPEIRRAAFIMGLATTAAEADVASAYARLACRTTHHDRQVQAETILDPAAIAVVDVTSERTNARAETFAIARADAEAIAAFIRRGHWITRSAELLAHGGCTFDTNARFQIAITTRRTFGVVSARGQTQVARGHAITRHVFTPMTLEFVEWVVQVHELRTKLATEYATAFRRVGIRLETNVRHARTIAAGLALHGAVAVRRTALENGIHAGRRRAYALRARFAAFRVGCARQTKPIALRHRHARA